MAVLSSRVSFSIHPVFWLFAAIIGWVNSMTMAGTLIWVVVIFVSVVVHEAGHALSGLAFNQRVRIELVPFGGMTYRLGSKLKLWQEFIVVFNGPIFGFALAGLAYLIQQRLPAGNSSELSLFAYAVNITLVANIFWSLINLVPVLPLDGGHLLSIILESIFGTPGIKAAVYVGIVISVLMSIVFFIFGLFVAGGLFILLAFEGYRSVKYYRMMSPQDRNEDLRTLYVQGEAQMASGDRIGALETFKQVREVAKKGVTFIAATEQMAHILAFQNSEKEAFALISPFRKVLSPISLKLLQRLAYGQGEYKMVTELGNELFQGTPDGEIAFWNALAYAAMGEVHPTIGWLYSARGQQYKFPTDLFARPVFNSVRSDPRFQALMESLK